MVKEELEEMEDVEEEETKTTETASNNSTNDFKSIVIKECKRIIEQYKTMMIEKDNDPYFIQALKNEKKSDDECVNYIMNELTKKRIYGGDDSLMYPYIHDYYVDEKLAHVKIADGWSQSINRGATVPQSSQGGAKAQAKEEAKAKITEEQKQKFYEQALEEAQAEAKRKAEEKLKADAEKAKEKERLRKEKEAEAKKLAAEKKAQEEANKPKQLSLFDL